MKTFEAFFTYRIKGSHTADARVLVQAEDVDAAQQKITTAFQRAVDGETPKEAPPIERGHARLVWVAPVETPLDEVRKTSGKPEVHAPPVAHQPAPKPEIKPGTFENALNFVRTTPPAISGKGGHAHTFSVARMLVESQSLSDSEVWTLLLEFNRRCEPPWSETELRRKLDEAKAASGRVVAPVEPSTDFYCAHPACLLERNNNRNEPCPHCGRNNAGIGEGPPQETSVPLTVEEVAVVRRWLLSPRSGSYKRSYPKNSKLAPYANLAAAYETQKQDRASSVEKPDGSTEETLAVYKLRTECWADTVSLLRVVYANRVTIQNHGVNGADVTLKNPRFGGEVVSLEKLRDLIHDRIQDSHVMTETLTQERT